MTAPYRVGRVVSLPWLICAFALVGCGTADTQVFKDGRVLAPLDVPPDLIVPRQDPGLAVPAPRAKDGGEASQGSAEGADRVSLGRDGALHWLVIQDAPSAVWPQLRAFVLEQGFTLAREDQNLGVLETPWVDATTVAPLPDPLQAALNIVGQVSARDRFRFRLERGVRGDTCEVFVTHRRMIATDATGTGTWVPVGGDPELEIDMLGLMMRYLGANEKHVEDSLKAVRRPADRTELIYDDEGLAAVFIRAIEVQQAWRRVGVALDRSGMEIVAAARREGRYVVVPEGDSTRLQVDLNQNPEGTRVAVQSLAEKTTKVTPDDEAVDVLTTLFAQLQ